MHRIRTLDVLVPAVGGLFGFLVIGDVLGVMLGGIGPVASAVLALAGAATMSLPYLRYRRLPPPRLRRAEGIGFLVLLLIVTLAVVNSALTMAVQ